MAEPNNSFQKAFDKVEKERQKGMWDVDVSPLAVFETNDLALKQKKPKTDDGMPRKPDAYKSESETRNV